MTAVTQDKASVSSARGSRVYIAHPFFLFVYHNVPGYCKVLRTEVITFIWVVFDFLIAHKLEMRSCK